MRGIARIFTAARRCAKFNELQWQQMQAPAATASVQRPLHCSAIGAGRPQTERLQQQQTRKYAPAVDKTSPLTPCWNCEKTAGKWNHMICDNCGYLQDVDADINYFELLNFEKCFNLEAKQLTKSFRELQSIVHPDKFSSKSLREQMNSDDWSSLINKAYKTLATPIERGQYMLRLHGMQIPKDNSALDKEFLMEMMERNEEVEDAGTKQELDELYERINLELSVKSDELNAQFKANALEVVKAILVQMKYLISIQKSIKNKLQSLM